MLHKPGYNAGDTLRLLPPFLKAFEVTDEDVELFSEEGVLLVPGALKALEQIGKLMPAYIISTSYTPYLTALCAVSGFAMDHVRCTELSLDAWDMTEDEKAWLREQAGRVMSRRRHRDPRRGGVGGRSVRGGRRDRRAAGRALLARHGGPA